MKMDKALYRRSSISKEVWAKNVSRRQYYEEYRGHLFCPEDGCNAKLSFVQRKNNTKYFRTFPSTDHKDGCPNEVEYDDIKDKVNLKSYDKRINLSNRHINDVLDRAFSKIMIKTFNIQRYRDGKKKGNTKNNNSVGSSGVAELFNEGIDSERGREPYITTRFYSEITETDDKEIRCVIGYVANIQLLGNHGYINLTPKMEKSVKLHFAEYFVANNKTEFEKMDIIESYINLMKSEKKDIICCSIGRVKFVNTGINILIDRYNGFTLNGLKFYEIILHMQNQTKLETSVTT